jgi:pimeloyl-ACP methyl ester carboxylesterase
MFISLEDTRIFALSFGPAEGPPMLALSGWIGSWEDWADTLSALSEQWRTISYDHRGSGATIAPAESITFGRLVDDVFAVMDAYEVERCMLAAMSMASAVALGAALREPERVSGLVLVDPLDLRGGARESDPFLVAMQNDYPATLARFIDACVPEPASDHIKRWGRQILDRASQEAAVVLYRMALSVDLRSQLDFVTQPTLIIHGDADMIAPIEGARWLSRALPNAKLAVLEGTGHVPIMTRPLEVATLINEFAAARL